MKKYIKQFFYLLDKQSKTQLPYLIASFFFLSILDIAGISLVGAFLALLIHSSLSLQKFQNYIGNCFVITENNLIVCFGLLIILAFSVKTYLSLLIQNKIVFFSQSLSIHLKERLMSAYQYAPLSYHLQTNTALLLSRLHDNINYYALNSVMSILNLLSNTIVLTAILTFLAILHPLMTGILLICFMGVAIVCHFYARKKIMMTGAIYSTTSGELMKFINQGLHGLTEIRVLGKEKYFIHAIKTVSHRYAFASGTLSVLQLIPRYIIENMLLIFVVGLCFSGLMLGVDTRNMVILTGLFAAAGTRLLPVVNQIIASIQQIRSAQHHGELIYNDLIALSCYIDDAKITPSDQNNALFTTITLRNMTYQYPKARYPTLNKINMEIKKGTFIGLIGPSGAGKSTLIHLLLGLLDPEEGTLLADGRPIHNKQAWLKHFAYIPQNIFLLDDTLKRNIAFGSEDASIDDARIRRVIEMAQLEHVVDQLPNALDTLIGENGIRLSGGQRQRVAIARALYHERDILIMDEATSALDYVTENQIIQTIKNLAIDKTILMITHRLSAIEQCDHVFCLENGSLFITSPRHDFVENVMPDR